VTELVSQVGRLLHRLLDLLGQFIPSHGNDLIASGVPEIRCTPVNNSTALTRNMFHYRAKV